MASLDPAFEIDPPGEGQRGPAAVSRTSPVPLHHQVRLHLLGAIERGELGPGERLANEREYAAHFGISLAPVRQAILDLVKEGYLYRVRGRGTFVREHKVEEKIAILSSFSESMRSKGLRAEMRTLEQSVVRAPERIRAVLGVEQVFHLRRVASVGGETVALLSAYLPAELVPGLEHMALVDGSLYRTLETRFGIVLARAESTIEVVRCGPEEAALLGVPAATPTLQVEGATYDMGGTLVEFSRVTYRADRFRFTIESFRRDDRVLHVIGAPGAEEEMGS